MLESLLGIQKAPDKDILLLNGKIQAKHPPKKRSHVGLSREVQRLYGDSASSLLLQQQALEERASDGPVKVQKWVLDRIANSAHPSKTLHLHQWCPETESEPLESQSNLSQDNQDPAHNAHSSSSELFSKACCTHRSKHDHPGASFNRKPNIVRYSPSLYTKLLSNLSKHWTQWETDYLMYLCGTYDLNFIVISDRYAPLQVLASHTARNQRLEETRDIPASLPPNFPPHEVALTTMSSKQLKELTSQVEACQPRSLCHLKNRYYTIAKKVLEYEHLKKTEAIEARFSTLASSATVENMELLTQQRAQLLADARAEFARHPLVKFSYDMNADHQRRSYMSQHFRQGSLKKIKDREKELVQEVLTATSASAQSGSTPKETSGKKLKLANQLFLGQDEGQMASTDEFMTVIKSTLKRSRSPPENLAQS